MTEKIDLKNSDVLFLVFGDIGMVEDKAYVCRGIMLKGAIQQGDVLCCVSLDEPSPGEILADKATAIVQNAVFGGAKYGGTGSINESLDTKSAPGQMSEALFLMDFPIHRRVPRLAMVRCKGINIC